MDEAEEERLFMETGLWFQREIERRMGKPLDAIHPSDVDDHHEGFGEAFHDELCEKLLLAGRTEELILTARKVHLLLHLAFDTWFTEN
ncbi:MAG: hypothetical protein HQL56_11345 [Magnetococcales bacterium]|nr:hypothetical protein [Magnetococcales bacterium]